MSEPRKPRNTRPGGADAPDEITAPTEISPDLLSRLRDESDRVTERRRIIIGPDGQPIVLDDDADEDEHELTTRRMPAKRET
jgi:hypothetical protein